MWFFLVFVWLHTVINYYYYYHLTVGKKIREKRPVTKLREKGRNGVTFVGEKCHSREYDSLNSEGDLRGDLQIDDRVGRCKT